MFLAKLVTDRIGRFFSTGVGCALCLGAGLALSGPRVWAQAEPSSAVLPADQVITSIQQYWDLTPEQKSRPQAFEFECYVTFFDRDWTILFIQDLKGSGAYVPYGDNPFPFKSGQRLLASGVFVPPNANVSFEHAKITTTSQGTGWPDAAPTAGKLTHTSEFITKFVSLEGFVDRFRQVAPGTPQGLGYLQMTLSAEGMPVIVWVQIEPGQTSLDLTDATVRIEGVYNPKIGPDGKLASLEIMVPSFAHLTVINHLKDDPRFTLPIVPIDSLAKRPADQRVRVAGLVKAQESGRFVRIRDDTGQIDIITGQTRPCVINELIEAVGYPSINGTEWQLVGGQFRAVPLPTGVDAAPVAAGTQTGPLRLAAQVLELSAKEASEERAVWLMGVVTWSHRDFPFFFIQDSSGGVCVMRDKSNSMLRSPGRNVEVRGVTGMGQFAPVVQASRFDRVSDLPLPIARQTSLEHALTGVEEAQWVEMRGYLRQIHQQDGWNQLEMATAAGDFIAMLPPNTDVSNMIGAVVRLHGVCTASTTEQRKLTGIKLWVPSAEYVQVEEPAPRDPFDVPQHTLASLGQYGGVQSFNRRLRVSGTVLYQAPGHSISIQEGGDSLQILARSKAPLQPGDRIEAVGFLGRQGGRVVLREAVCRKTGSGAQPAAHRLEVEKQAIAAEDGQLVTIEGVLIGNSRAADQIRLTLQTQNAIFEAYLEGARQSGDPAGLSNNSRLALTGVYEVKYDQFGQPEAFQLNLRSTADIALVESPSWWTRGRILGITGTLALGTLTFIAWVAALRRRVNEQTAQIREQLKRESWLEAELQRAGKLESLGLLAGGIAHDFNNLLTVMMGNLSLAGLDENLTEDSVKSLRTAEKAAVRARDLTQQLLTFAKGGAPIRGAVSLPEVVREVAEFALRGAKTRCEFEIPADLWPANADKGQIGQVVQNIVINAMQAMSVGGLIKISLRNETVGAELSQMMTPGRYVHLAITDHGPGISPEDLQRIFDPYFTTKKQGNGLGLATVYSIVKKHLGHISAESVPGQGTTFKIWLPAAKNEAVPEIIPVLAAPTDTGRKTARVLFMDDEESICHLGSAILRRIGKEVTTVTEGAQALQEFERARQAGQPYDLVILDLTIPGGMGGRETMQRLLQLDPEIKAIVSSGYSNDLVLSDYQAHGFCGMISKPYDIADFTHAVERVLKGERA